MTNNITIKLVFCVFFILLTICGSFINAQDEDLDPVDPVDSPDIVYFSPTAGHIENNLFTDFDGYVTCNRIAGCPQSDILTITINNEHPEMDTKSKFVQIDVYLADGTVFSQAPLNQTVFMGITSKLPMKTIRGLNHGETLFFSGQIEWHGVSAVGQTTIEFGYGQSYETAIKHKYNQAFYTDIKQHDDVLQSLDTKVASKTAPWPYEFVLYVQTPQYPTTSFTLRPFGGISNVNAVCTIDNIPISITVEHNPDDILQKFPTYQLTIPPNQISQFQSFKPDTQVQISCTGFTHNPAAFNHGFTVLAHDSKAQTGIVTLHRFGKLLSSQTATMALADGTVDVKLPAYHSYTMKAVDSHGATKIFSYHTVHAELSSPNLTFPSNKTFHLFLDGIRGGAISLSRWSLTVRDETGTDLPYTTTDKLKVAWYADGKVARFDTWTVGLTKEMRERYDPTKGARLTISFVLSFDPTVILPPVITPTAMIAVEQDVHWVNFASTKETVSFYQFITPVLSRMAMVTAENFEFVAFHPKHNDDKDEEESSSSEKKTNYLLSAQSNDENSPDFIGAQELFGFNVTLANVQYLDFERPHYFSLSIPTREFNFAGQYDTCTLNNEKIGIVDPYDFHKALSYTNHHTLVFNQTLQPSVNYKLSCPHAFLTNSSSSNADRHKDKDIMVQFIATSDSPDTNFYTTVAATYIDFGHNDHDSGTVFAIVTMVTLSILFVAILVYIVIDRKRKNAAENKQNGRDNVEISGADSPTEGHNNKPQGQYQQFSDSETVH